jgi:probable HAF family extracellular repeat protein
VYRDGTFTTINDPAAAAGTTMPSGINDLGVIVGGYQDKITGKTDGFKLSPAH